MCFFKCVRSVSCFVLLKHKFGQQSKNNSACPLLTDAKLFNVPYLVDFSLKLRSFDRNFNFTTNTKIEIGSNTTVVGLTTLSLKLLETQVFTNSFPLQIFLLM